MIRCPDCGAEIDVDEDEVEEGEILSCPECESELEVTQTHPVHLNPISDDLDEEDDEDEEEDEDDSEEDDDEEDEIPKRMKKRTKSSLGPYAGASKPACSASQ